MTPPEVAPKKKSSAKKFGGALIVLAVSFLFFQLLGGGAWIETAVSRLKPFHIKTVTIQTGWPLTQAIVESWLPPLQGKSLLTLSASEIIEAVKDKSWVGSVSVKKEFPDRLLISVDCKTPKAIFHDGSALFFVDSDGKTIEQVNPLYLRIYDLPIISWNKNFRWSAKSIVAINQKLITELKGVSQILVAPYPLFSVFLSSPRVKVTLSDENWEQQLSYLRRWLDEPLKTQRSPEHINLTVPKKVIVSSLISQ